MPDRDVKTIRDLIFYLYAKIIARRAFDAADGKAAKEQSLGYLCCSDYCSRIQKRLGKLYRFSEVQEYGRHILHADASFFAAGCLIS